MDLLLVSPACTKQKKIKYIISKFNHFKDSYFNTCKNFELMETNKAKKCCICKYL